MSEDRSFGASWQPTLTRRIEAIETRLQILEARLPENHLAVLAEYATRQRPVNLTVRPTDNATCALGKCEHAEHALISPEIAECGCGISPAHENREHAWLTRKLEHAT